MTQYNYIEKEMTVGELRELYLTQKFNIELDTPDGWNYIGEWFDKGPLPVVRVDTENGFSSVCANNHMIETNEGMVIGDGTSSNLWMAAVELGKGQLVLTKTGFSEVVSVESVGIEECYDFEIMNTNHRYWGDGISSHNSGKSFICSGNVVREAQKKGIYVVLIDTENALDESWLLALGVDTSPEKIMRISASMVDDVAKIISDFMKDYKTNYASEPKDQRPKVMFVIDSIGMLMTPTDIAQFERGEMKGDMGRKPKALKALVTNVTNMFGEYDIGLVATNHSYASQDPFSPDPIMSGGSGLVYAASIVVAMVKRKLKEDEDGNKTSEVNGIRAAIKIMKSRYAKPFETMEIKIPYESGMDKFSGLIDFFEDKGILVKQGNKLKYMDLAGVEHMHFRKQITDDLLMQIMLETKDTLAATSKSTFIDTSNEMVDPETGEITIG